MVCRSPDIWHRCKKNAAFRPPRSQRYRRSHDQPQFTLQSHSQTSLAAGDPATVVGGAEAAEATDTDLADVQRAHNLLNLQTDTETAHELLDLLDGDAAATADRDGLFGMLRRRRQPGDAQAAGE